VIETFTFKNLQLNETYTFNTDTVPFTSAFDIRVEDRNEHDRAKTQDHGVWPTFSYHGGMAIDIGGEIHGSSPENYTDTRLAVVRIFRGSGAPPTVRGIGEVRVRFSGQTEDWKTTVNIAQFSAPLKAGYITYSEFMVTFFSFNPYFIGVTSGDKHYYS
jgi:hypothetical protein